MSTGHLADGVEVARVRQDDADVGQRRLHQHRRHITVSQLLLQALDVVELGHPAGHRHIDRRTDVARPAGALAIFADDDERLVDRPVVAVAVDEDLRSPGEGSHQPDRPTVGVGRGEREAPDVHPEPARQLGAHPFGILGGEHRRQPAEVIDSPSNGGNDRLGGVPRHRAGVTQGEVDVVVPVDVPHPAPAAAFEVEGEAARFLVHPGHRHPPEEVVSPAVCRRGARMGGGEAVLLGRHEGGQAGAVDHGRPSCPRCHRCVGGLRA